MVLMQMAQNNFQVKQDFSVKNSPITTSKTLSNDDFGSMLTDVMKSDVKADSSIVKDAEHTNHETTMEVLQATTLEEVVETLDLEMDPSLLFATINGEQIALDDLLSTESLAELLQIDSSELAQIIAQLSNEEIDVNDIWVLLENAPKLMETIIGNLKENETVEGTDKLLVFLKLAQLVGEKQDTIYSQQYTLSSLKQTLQEVTETYSTLVKVEQPKQAVNFTAVQHFVSFNQSDTAISTTTQSSNQQQESLLQQQAQPTILQSGHVAKTVVLNMPTNPTSQAEAIAKEIQNLINKNQMVNNNGTLKLVLKLFPENLGQIRIEVAQQNGILTARLMTTTSAGKELLDSNLNQLKATLAAQSIQMDRIDIAQSLQDADKNYKEQGLFKQFFNQPKQEEEPESEADEEEQKAFSEYLDEEVL